MKNINSPEFIKQWMDKRAIHDNEVVLSSGTAQNDSIHWANPVKTSELLLQLAQSIHAQFSQQQSDSVDAKEYLESKGYKFGMEYGMKFSIMVGLLNEFAGSKVKPVNEITEALKDLIQQIKYPSRGSSDKHGKMIARPNIVRAELALSIASDDGWIPVEKELPKDNSNVIVALNENDVLQGEVLVITGFYERGKWCDEQGDELTVTVTHWQPLPKSPR